MKIRMVIDCADPRELAGFYEKLLSITKPRGVDTDEFVIVDSGELGMYLCFQKNDEYEQPVWPEENGKQKIMAHVDVDTGSQAEKEKMVKHALSCGASLSSEQYSDHWTVMIDPAGHPFCICVSEGWD